MKQSFAYDHGVALLTHHWVLLGDVIGELLDDGGRAVDAGVGEEEEDLVDALTAPLLGVEGVLQHRVQHLHRVCCAQSKTRVVTSVW